jgi:hypothetical protein
VDRISAVFPRAMPKTRRANRHRSALQLSKRAQRRRNRDGGQRMRHASTYGVLTPGRPPRQTLPDLYRVLLAPATTLKRAGADIDDHLANWFSNNRFFLS